MTSAKKTHEDEEDVEGVIPADEHRVIVRGRVLAIHLPYARIRCELLPERVGRIFALELADRLLRRGNRACERVNCYVQSVANRKVRTRDIVSCKVVLRDS